MSLGEVFTWANTSLLSNLFGVYPGKNMRKSIHIEYDLFCLCLSDGTVDSSPDTKEKVSDAFTLPGL